MLTSSFTGLSLHSQRGCVFAPQAPATHTLDRCRGAGPLTIEAAHKKGGGSTKNGRDSNSQRRGVKVYGGQPVKAGGIIVRQVGSTVHPGVNVKEGSDHTLFAVKAGIVVFQKNKYEKKVKVVDFSEYEKPEGCKVKEGSRKMRRKQQYSSRKETVGVAAVAAP